MSENKRATAKTSKTRAESTPIVDHNAPERSVPEYQAILATAEEVANIGSWKWDLQTQKVTWSDQMFRLFGVERKGFDGNLSRIIADRIHPDDVAAVNESNRRVLEESDPNPLAYRLVLPDGTERTVWAQGKLIRDENGRPIALTGFVQDISERVRADRKVLQMKRLYATLSQVNQMIVRVKDRLELFQTICDVSVKFGEFCLAWVGVLHDQTGDIVPTAANGADIKHWPFPIANVYCDEFRNSLSPTAIRTGNVTTSEDIQADARIKNFQHLLQGHGYHAAAVVPFRLRGKCVGVLVLVALEKGLFKDPDEINLLEEMGLDISFALDIMENDRERQQAEDRLRENEERLRLSLSAANQGLYDLNVQTGNAIVNRQYAEMLGYEYETFVETNAFWIERLHPDDREITAQAYRDYVSGLRPEYRVEFRQRTRDGKWKWILSLGRVIEYDSEGKPLRMLGTHTDIDQRKVAEQALTHSHDLLRYIIEHNRSSVAIHDRDMKYIYVSQRYLDDYGLHGQDVIGRHHYEVFPDLPQKWREVHQRVLKGEVLSAEDDLYERADGSVEWTRWECRPWYETDGSIGGLIVYTELITERKRAQESLERNERVLRLFVEHSPASIAMFDRDMRYIVASKRYLIDYRLGQTDLTGCSHYEIFPEMPERWKEIHRRCLNGAIEKADEDPFPRLDGTLDWVQWEIRPWYEEGGNVGGIILFSEVITERKHIQDELRLLNASLEQRVAERTAELERANRAKDEFLANMSHELRTPLSSILGLSETLMEQRRGYINEHQQRSLQVIHASGQHLLELINDILDLSKIEAGKTDFSPQLVAVNEVCKSSLLFIKAQATKKSILVTYDNQAVFERVVADERRLKQILVNLLTNAVKFTPNSGNVTLRVTSDIEKELILFQVIDNGIGIARRDLEKLFQPFVQLDSSLNRQYEGTGLGLALIQKLVDLHGGSIHVESEPGQGSCFTVQLRCSQENIPATAVSQRVAGTLVAALADETERKPQSESRGVILLAEDNDANIFTIAEYVKDLGYQVVVAHDGAEAIEKAAEVNPDIILMDIQMPVLDGLQAIQQLRADIRFAATPIIAVTALAMAGDRERCLAAGANEYMSKPVNLKVLAKRIGEYMESINQ